MFSLGASPSSCILDDGPALAIFVFLWAFSDVQELYNPWKRLLAAYPFVAENVVVVEKEKGWARRWKKPATRDG